MSTKRVLMPLPREDFDPTESGAPWQVLTANGVKVEFATPDGRPGQVADPWMLEEGEEKLEPFGRWMIADKNGRNAYHAMAESEAFRSPIGYDKIALDPYDGLVLPGGHAAGIREYIESTVLQARVAPFFEVRKPIGAICHGVVMAGRCRRGGPNGPSVLEGYKTTALPKSMELFAWKLTRHLEQVQREGYSYLTYPDTTVEDEVRAKLGPTGRFEAGSPVCETLDIPEDPEAFAAWCLAGGPLALAFTDLLRAGLKRDSLTNAAPAFVVEDDTHLNAAGRRHYVSARWPGDAFTFARRFLALL